MVTFWDKKIKGGFAFLSCGEDTISLFLKNSWKTIYMRHLRFLRKNHRYRNMVSLFDGSKKVGLVPITLSGDEVFNKVQNVNVVLGKTKCDSPKKDEPKLMWKKRSIFWDYLPYWSDLDICHSIDALHLTKNVCESVL